MVDCQNYTQQVIANASDKKVMSGMCVYADGKSQTVKIVVCESDKHFRVIEYKSPI